MLAAGVNMDMKYPALAGERVMFLCLRCVVLFVMKFVLLKGCSVHVYHCDATVNVPPARASNEFPKYAQKID